MEWVVDDSTHKTLNKSICIKREVVQEWNINIYFTSIHSFGLGLPGFETFLAHWRRFSFVWSTRWTTSLENQ